MAQIMETRTQFLDLRLHLRLEIYKLAGITRPCPIDLGKKPFVTELQRSTNRSTVGISTVPDLSQMSLTTEPSVVKARANASVMSCRSNYYAHAAVFTMRSYLCFTERTNSSLTGTREVRGCLRTSVRALRSLLRLQIGHIRGRPPALPVFTISTRCVTSKLFPGIGVCAILQGGTCHVTSERYACSKSVRTPPFRLEITTLSEHSQ